MEKMPEEGKIEDGKDGFLAGALEEKREGKSTAHP